MNGPFVKFLLDPDALARRSGQYGNEKIGIAEVAQACWEHLGLAGDQREHLARGRPAWIVVRPERFVRWMVWRDAAGITNTFRELQVSIIDRVFEEVPPTFFTGG